jgi:hypothetical protein
MVFGHAARLYNYRFFLSSALGLKRSEMKIPPPEPWTPEDEARLRALAASGRSVATIAERLKRTPAAIRYKAHKLNISLPRAERGLKATGPNPPGVV